MTELPGGWVWAQFNDVARVASDLVDPASWADAPHVAPNHIESGTGRLRGVTTVAEDGVTSPKHRFHAGQVLYSKIRPYLAKAALAPYSGLCSADMYPIESSIENRYLLHWMLTDDFTGYAASYQGRSVLPKINQAALATLPVPLAPMSEQQRIVEAIEEGLSKLDAGEAGLRIVRQLLKRLRNAILAAASTGRLIPQDPADTPASNLLADLGAQQVDPPAGPTLPRTWTWCALGSLARDSGYGTSVKCSHEETGVGVLRIPNIQRGALDLDDLKRAPTGASIDAELLLMPGDLLIVRTNGSRDLIGRCAPVMREVGCSFASYLIRFRTLPDAVDARFLSILLAAPWWRRELEGAAASSAGQYNLSLRALTPLPIALPPLEEQTRIIAEVERQMSFIEACERAVDAGLAQSAALRRSVLRSAFEGRLVPQDPTDEPASALLERLRAERAAALKSKRSRAGAKG